MKINVMSVEQERVWRAEIEAAREAGHTLAQVGENIYRINHPQVNASLTRSGGVASPAVLKRLFTAIGRDSLQCDIEFRRGNNTKRWYFQVA